VKVIVDGKPCIALIDCGAVVSLIKPDIAEGLVSKSNVNLIDIQGNKIPTLGVKNVTITFLDSIKVQHDFIVIDTYSFQADILLGIDFLRLYGIKLDWSNNFMYAFENVIPLLEEGAESKVSERLAKMEAEVEDLRRNILHFKEPSARVESQAASTEHLALRPIALGCDFQVIGRLLETNAVHQPTHKQKEAKETTAFIHKFDKDTQTRGADIGNNSLKELEDIDQGEEVKVILLEDMVIPPMTHVVCAARLTKLTRDLSPYVVLEPSDKAPKGLLIAGILCRTGCTVPIRMTNILESEMVIFRKTEVARVCETEQIENITGKGHLVRQVNKKESEEILRLLKLQNPISTEEILLRDLVIEYIDIFKSPDQKLSCTSNVMHRIITEEIPPILKRPYRVPFHRQEIFKKEVQKLLDDGIIEESQSPWSFPAILLEKKRHPGEEVQYRLVIDFRELNSVTKTDYFPLPNIQETIEKLSGACLFSTMDLASGYFQVPVHPDDQEKTGFSTPDNHYHFLRMAMGLKNATATLLTVNV